MNPVTQDHFIKLLNEHFSDKKHKHWIINKCVELIVSDSKNNALLLCIVTDTVGKAFYFNMYHFVRFNKLWHYTFPYTISISYQPHGFNNTQLNNIKAVFNKDEDLIVIGGLFRDFNPKIFKLIDCPVRKKSSSTYYFPDITISDCVYRGNEIEFSECGRYVGIGCLAYNDVEQIYGRQVSIYDISDLNNVTQVIKHTLSKCEANIPNRVLFKITASSTKRFIALSDLTNLGNDDEHNGEVIVYELVEDSYKLQQTLIENIIDCYYVFGLVVQFIDHDDKLELHISSTDRDTNKELQKDVYIVSE